MEDSYVSYNAIDEIDQSDDSEAIVSAANKKRKAAAKDPLTKKRGKVKVAETIDDEPQSKSYRKPRAKAKKAATKPKRKPASKAKPKTTPKSAAKSKPRKKASPSSKPSTVSGGLVTRGVHAGLRGFEQFGSGVRHMSPSAWCGLAAAVMLMTVTILAWTKSPTPPNMPLSLSAFQLQTDDGKRLPDAIWRDYVTKYPALKSWVVTGREGKHFKNPSAEDLNDFAAYLEKQSTIASVQHLELSYIERKDRLQRSLLIHVDLRTPEMPVILSNGQKAWVDAEGVLLPGLMPVPEAYADRPVIRSIEQHPTALSEVLSFWPDLEDVIEADLITDIFLDEVMQRSTNGMVLQRGIVLKTKQGTRIHWGRPGDDRFGLSNQDKIRNLLRTLNSQGNLRNTDVIDVRHSEPKYELAHGS